METKSTLYNEFPLFLKRYFPYKVQKISLNAGFTCPNRDGNKGVGGCTYCNNQTFNPDYCRTEKSITRQLEEGKQFFAHKYPEMKYLAYFQAYTNTYCELEDLKRKYEEALSADGVVGLVIGTRPDCMPDSLLDYLEEMNRHTFLLVEYGIESTDDKTLCRINRGHTFHAAADAVERTASRGILTGGHVILGLPGETVQIDENGKIYINGEVLEENYGAETIRSAGRASKPITLGEDEYFVMGDNRNNSKDSRSEDVGNVSRSQIIGRAWVRIWPLSKIGVLKHQ